VALDQGAEGGPGPTPEAGARRAQGAIDRVYAASAIRSRQSVVPDYGTGPDGFTLYPPNWRLEPTPSTAARMAVYRREAPPLARRAAERCLEAVTDVKRGAVSHLVVVSCTGFFAPGLDTVLVRDLGLRRDVRRTMIGFMGCCAAFNGLRAADAICRAEANAAVLVVCVELCTIHFQHALTMNNIVANSLFADGAAAVLVTDGASRRGALELLDSHSVLAEDSADHMTWTVTDTGFQMFLAAQVPDTLRAGIEPFVDALLERNGVRRDDVGFWAIHPGGRRIVEVAQERLGLRPPEVEPSFEVLAEHGNMSSPTVLFVLERALARRPPAGSLGVALAFGPGVTFESALVRVT
jgi:predicted naringenin-chalcone synthase